MRYFLFFACLFLALASQAQDLIYKKDGKILGARVLRTDSNFVYFKHADPPRQLDTIAQTEVTKIEFDYRKDFFVPTKKLANNAVSISLGGTSVLLGISYDRIISQERNYHFSARLGIGSLVEQTNINGHLSFNFHLNKAKTQFFELGAGLAVPINERNTGNGYYNIYITAPMLGYRLQRFEGFFFRVYISGLYMRDAGGNNWMPNRLYIPTLGLDFGYSF